MKAKTKRNSNIEVIKLIAVFLIILSSALPYGATYRGDETVYVNLNNTGWSLSHIIFTFFRWCWQIGDTLFIVVSAWFLCDNIELKVNKPVRMILDSWIISIMGLIVALCWMKPQASEIIRSFMPVRFSLNWFVGCYVMYYLIHPMLNNATEKMSQNAMKKFVLVLFIVYSIMGLIGQAYYYTNLVGFMCIHYFVTYYKKYMMLEKRYSRDVKVIAVSIIVILLWILAINVVSRYTGKFSSMNLFGGTFMNPLIILIGFAALNIAVTRAPRYSKLINSMTKFSLLIYLFHANYFWLTYGKYAWLSWLSNRGLPLLAAVCLTILCYVVATPVLSLVYTKIFDYGLNIVSDKISGYINREI